MLAQFEKELTKRKIKHCNNNPTKRTRWYWCSIKKPKIEHQRTWDLLTLKLSFSRKELYPPVEDIDFFPGFPVKFTVTLLEYFFWNIFPPGNPCFFLNFWFTSLEFQRLLLYPPGIFHWYPRQGVAILFWKSPLSLIIFLKFLSKKVHNSYL